MHARHANWHPVLQLGETGLHMSWAISGTWEKGARAENVAYQAVKACCAPVLHRARIDPALNSTAGIAESMRPHLLVHNHSRTAGIIHAGCMGEGAQRLPGLVVQQPHCLHAQRQLHRASTMGGRGCRPISCATRSCWRRDPEGWHMSLMCQLRPEPPCSRQQACSANLMLMMTAAHRQPHGTAAAMQSKRIAVI